MAKRKKKKGREPRTKKPRFAPVHGSRFTQRDAERICPVLLAELTAHGGLTREDLLELARSRRHPLHKEFTWDDSAAAEKYRLSEASAMLRSFEVVYYVRHDGEQPTEQRTKLLHYVRQDESDAIGPEEEADSLPQIRPKSSRKAAGRNCYVTTVEVMSTPKYQNQLIERAKLELLSYRNRYARLKELVNFKTKFGRVFAMIDKLYSGG